MSKLLLLGLSFFFAISSVSANGKDTLPNGKPFQILQDQISIINLTIAEMKVLYDAKFAELDAKDDSHDELITGLTIALDIVSARVGANEDNIEALQLADSLFEALVAQLTTRLAELELSTDASFTDLYDQDRVLNLLIGTLETRLSTLRNSLETTAFQLDTLRTEVVTYRTRLSALNNLLNSFCSGDEFVYGINNNGTPRCESVRELGTTTTRSSSLSWYRFCDSEIAGICVDEDYYESGSVFCPSGYVATGGGFTVNGFDNIGGNNRSMVSRPNGNTGWYVQTITHGNSNYNGTVYVRCLEGS
jgi:hypothetical protein